MTVQDFMLYWKNEEKCYEDTKIEGYDRTKAIFRDKHPFHPSSIVFLPVDY